MIREITRFPALATDCLTFSAAGEPTLARNLGAMIKSVRKARPGKIAVITNSSLLGMADLRNELLPADFVIAKLDAHSQDLFGKMNRPTEPMRIEAIVLGLEKFRSVYPGRLALQCMFTAINREYAEEIARVAKKIGPDEIQINTPLRPCGVAPLSREDLNAIEVSFRSICGKTIAIKNVYAAKRQKVFSVSGMDTLKRRGKP